MFNDEAGHRDAWNVFQFDQFGEITAWGGSILVGQIEVWYVESANGRRCSHLYRCRLCSYWHARSAWRALENLKKFASVEIEVYETIATNPLTFRHILIMQEIVKTVRRFILVVFIVLHHPILVSTLLRL